MASTVLSVPDIACGHCQATITNVLRPLAGGRAVTVDIPTKKVTVEYDPSVIQVDQLKGLLAEEDYPVESVE